MVKMSKVDEFQIGMVYRCIGNEFKHRGMVAGDYFVVLGVSETFVRYQKENQLTKTVNKIVLLSESEMMDSTKDFIISDWYKESFLQVDMETLDDGLFKKYIMNMNVYPSFFKK